MKNFSKIMAALITATTLTACTVGGSTAASNSSSASSASSDSSSEKADTSDYLIGVVQLVQHPALDNATNGFVDELKKELNLTDDNFDIQNAAGDSATCTTIANALVSENCDLILANATAALQAASSATTTIPVLGTAVTDYGTALGIDNFSGTVGNNVSGTTDLAPLDQQAQMFKELLPDAKNIGLVYCSSEANSVYQVNIVQKELENLGYSTEVYTFTDSNDVAAVVQTACADSDALYIPTDNTAASCTEAIDNVATKPIICGEEGIMSGCGIATLSIDYYNLGVATGKMAAQILKGEADVSQMAVESDPNPVKEYDEARCEKYGITVPSDYQAYTAE